MSKPFDILSALGRFGAERQISLRDRDAKRAFATHVSDAVDQALANPTWMHGHRTEAMFEALVISLGEFRLLKSEDNGVVFPAGLAPRSAPTASRKALAFARRVPRSMPAGPNTQHADREKLARVRPKTKLHASATEPLSETPHPGARDCRALADSAGFV